MQHGSVQMPPSWVRFRYRLGIPPPRRWRLWVASRVQDVEWNEAQRRRIRRWRRRYRALSPLLVLYVAVLVVVALVRRERDLVPGFVGGAIGSVATWLAMGRRKGQSEEEVVAAVRSSHLRWHGLRPDGSVAETTDRAMTIAWMPDWFLNILAAIELAVLVAMPVGLVLLLLVAL